MKHQFPFRKGQSRSIGQGVAAAVMALALAVSGASTTVLLASQPSGLVVSPSAVHMTAEHTPRAKSGTKANDETAQQTQPEQAQQETQAAEPAQQPEQTAEAPAAEQVPQQAEAAQPAEQAEAPAEQTAEQPQTETAEAPAAKWDEENSSRARFVQETPELAAEDPLSEPEEDEDTVLENTVNRLAKLSGEVSPVTLTPEQIRQALDEGALDETQLSTLSDENCLQWLFEWLFGKIFPSGKVNQPEYSGWHTDKNGNTYYYDLATHEALTGIHTIDGVLYYFDENGVQRDVTFGIDVSKYQSKIDWEKVKTSGVQFVIIRLGYRGYESGTLVQDPMFESHYAGARAAGLRVGAYIFSQAVNENEAREEAQASAYVLNGRALDYPLYFDSEASGSSNGTGRADGLSAGDRTKCAVAFCEEIRNLGYRPGVYASTLWFAKRLEMSSLAGYSLWDAHYDVIRSGIACDIWQGTCQGRVNGYSGTMDINISYIG